MATLTVGNREFSAFAGQLAASRRQGDTIVIISSEGPSLTLSAGKPKAGDVFDWEEHFEWLKKQPVTDKNPVDELRKRENR